jgi:small subunit ribosomal protein S17
VIEEQENQETTEEETPEPEEAPEAEARAEEPAAEEAAAEEEAPVEELEDEDASDEGVPTSAPEPADTGREAEDVGGGISEEPAEALSPKQLRKRERATHAGEPLPPRSPEERAAERAERRRKKATVRRARRAAERARRTPGTGTPPAERATGTKAVRQGTVVSDQADKTITVRLEIVRRHPKYEKIVRRTAKVRAHDENNDAHTGDVVRLIESRPTSRSKRWRLVEVLERAR